MLKSLVVPVISRHLHVFNNFKRRSHRNAFTLNNSVKSVEFDPYASSPSLQMDPLINAFYSAMLLQNVVDSSPLIGRVGSKFSRTVCLFFPPLQIMAGQVIEQVSQNPQLVRELYSSYGTQWNSWLRAAFIAEVVCVAKVISRKHPSCAAYENAGQGFYFNNYASRVNAQLSGISKELLEIAASNDFTISMPWLASSVSVRTNLDLYYFITQGEQTFEIYRNAVDCPDIPTMDGDKAFCFLPQPYAQLFDTIKKYYPNFTWDVANIGNTGFLDKPFYYYSYVDSVPFSEPQKYCDEYYRPSGNQNWNIINTPNCVKPLHLAYGSVLMCAFDDSIQRSSIFNNITGQFEVPNNLFLDVIAPADFQLKGLTTLIFYGMYSEGSISDFIFGNINYNNNLDPKTVFTDRLNLRPSEELE